METPTCKCGLTTNFHVEWRCVRCEDGEIIFACADCKRVLRVGARYSPYGHDLRLEGHEITGDCLVAGSVFTPEGCIAPVSEEEVSDEARKGDLVGV